MGRYGRRDLRTLETAVFKIGGPERSARLRLAASDGGEIELEAVWRATPPRSGHLRQLGLGLFNEDLTGKIDADLNLAGKGARLDGTLDARLEDARAKGSDVSQGLDDAKAGWPTAA